MNLTVQQRIRLGFWLLALLPVILGLLAARNAYDLAQAARHVALTNDISRRLEKLFSDIKDVEVAQREYILSGGEDALSVITRSEAVIDTDLRTLRELRSKWEMDAQDQWMAHLETLIPQKLQDIQAIIKMHDENGPDAASQMLLANRGTQAIDDIRTAIRNMIAEEDQRLKKRSDEQTASFVRTIILFIGVLVVNVALIAMVYFLQRRETEQARRANEELERRVALRTEALQRSNEDLQQFAYIASHDLREPLRMISSYTTLLQRRYAGRLDADADTFINFIVDGVHRMHALIQDILEYSRAGGGGDEKVTDVEVDRILRNVLTNLKVTISESGASVRWHDLPKTVPYDEIRLTQIFQNLISNAIKYRGERRPDVVIEATHEGDEIVFAVRDNGIGIEPEFINKIFGIFQRLHGKEYEGTGIGLAMVKKIVERYRGRIWAQSTPGVGSTFFFTIHLTAQLAPGDAFSTSAS